MFPAYLVSPYSVLFCSGEHNNNFGLRTRNRTEHETNFDPRAKNRAEHKKILELEENKNTNII